MPKANLRAVPGARPFQQFERSVCKETFWSKGDWTDPNAAAVLKASVFKQWDAHLFSAHRRQWDFQQAANAKREAAMRLANKAKPREES